MVDREFYERSLREHHELQRLNRELIGFLEHPRPEPGSPDAHDWASTLNRQLVTLHERLTRQIREEESAGTMQRLAERHPRAADRLEELRLEHEELFEELRAILSASMIYAENRTPHNPRLREWTRGMLNAFSDHENRETALILELMNTDVGTGD